MEEILLENHCFAVNGNEIGASIHGTFFAANVPLEPMQEYTYQ